MLRFSPTALALHSRHHSMASRSGVWRLLTTDKRSPEEENVKQWRFHAESRLVCNSHISSNTPQSFHLEAFPHFVFWKLERPPIISSPEELLVELKGLIFFHVGVTFVINFGKKKNKIGYIILLSLVKSSPKIKNRTLAVILVFHASKYLLAGLKKSTKNILFFLLDSV